MTEDPWGLDALDVPEDGFVFNGVDADTGSYLFPRTLLDRVAGAAKGERQDPAHLADLEARKLADAEDRLTVVFGRRPERLSEVGWALVTADNVGPEIIEALAPLR